VIAMASTSAIAIAALLVMSARSASGLTSIHSAMGKLDQRLSSLESQLDARDEKLAGRLDRLDTTAATLGQRFEQDLTSDPASDEPHSEVRSIADAKEYMAVNLGKAPTADLLAEAAADLDSWFVEPEQDEEFSNLQSDLNERLRKQVSRDAAALHAKALAADSAKKAAESHSEAARILALFPLSGQKAVLNEAKRLAHAHSEIAARLEVLARQRYNRWATERVAAAIDGYNAKKSYWNPKKENPDLINSLVTNLGEVDPVLLEPAVLELYNYALDLTKSSISENDKVDLARRLTDLKTNRKKLGDI